MRTRWTTEEEAILIEHGSNMMASEILKILPNKTLQQLRDKMYKNGIRISQETHSRVMRIYNLNEEYFRTQTQNMAYILGLWWSDGSIAPSHTGILNEFSITLKDEEQLLTEVRNEMGADIPLKIHKKTGSFVLKLFSRKICQDLITLGGCQIDIEFIPAFIRGYFDGDGCMSCKTTGNLINMIFACGDKTFLDTLFKTIKSIDTSINGGWISKDNKNSCFTLGFGEKDSVKLAKIIYNENTGNLYMKRKYDKFAQLYNNKFQG
jgi:hypothetical protein